MVINRVLKGQGGSGDYASIFVTGLPHYEPKGVPSGYEELHWIESTGTQYIDTGISPTANTKFICKFAFTEWSTNGTILSAQANNYANFVLRSNSSGNINGYVQGNAISGAISLGTAYDYAMVSNGSSTILKVGDTQVSSVNAVCNNVSTTFALFADHENTTYKAYAKGRLYISELYDNDTLVRNFVPCIRTSDGAVGMYDKVSNAFFGNSGTGVFLAGARVVELPTGYQQVEYIQSSGTQYINTGIIAENGIEVKCRVITAPSSGIQNLIGSDEGSTLSTFFNIYNNSDSIIHIDSGASFSTGLALTGAISVKTVGGTLTVSNGANTYTASGASLGTLTYPMFIFARNASGTAARYFTGSVGIISILKNNTLVRDFIPVISPTNAVGMYDLVSEQFFGNAGTGVFTAGARVDMPTTVTCTTPKGEVLQGVWETKTGQAPYEIPTMTSNTTPSGYTASANNSYAEAYTAFSGATTYESDCKAYIGYRTGKYIRLQMPQAVSIRSVSGTYLLNYYSTWGSLPQSQTFKIQGSNDGSTWTDLTNPTTATTDSSSVKSVPFNVDTITESAFSYIQLISTACSGTETDYGGSAISLFQIDGYTSYQVSGYSFPDLKDYGTYTLTARQGNRVSTEEVLVDMATEYEVEMDFKLWLYKDGDECEDITGGWTYTYNSGNASNMCKNTGSQIYVTGTGTTYIAGGGTAKIRNTISLAGYTNIGIEIATCTGSTWDDTHSYIGYGDLSDMSYPLKPYYGKVQQNVSAATSFLYAISNFNTNTAIGVFGNGSNYASISVYINKVWLE